jgi:hypothetical protein
LVGVAQQCNQTVTTFRETVTVVTPHQAGASQQVEGIAHVMEGQPGLLDQGVMCWKIFLGQSKEDLFGVLVASEAPVEEHQTWVTVHISLSVRISVGI